MKDLISREDLISAICDNFERSKFYLRLDFIELISKMPAADVAEVKHGEWIEQEDGFGDTYYDCSCCGESFCLIEGTPTDNMYNFCPNCGARMVEHD